MQIVPIIKNASIKLSKEDVKNLEYIFSFQKKGIYYSPGRTCYYKLKKQVIIDNISYSYIKIKGCGALDCNNKFSLPGIGRFEREDPHFGIDENGNAILCYSEPAPYGGIKLSRAINEYENFKYLHDNNVSTLIPIGVLKYEHLYFDNQELGISLSLCEKNMPFRMDKLLCKTDNIPKEYFEFYKQVYFLEFNKQTDLNFEDKANLIKRIAYKYGKEMRKFCNCGMCIHSGGWSNIQYSFSKKNIVLVDLDSSKKIDNEKNFKILNCRELVSNIYRLFINLYNPKCISEYNQYIIQDTNYILSLLKGFFSEVEVEKLEEISYSINNYYIKNCFNEIKKIEKIMLDIPKEDVKNYELSIFDFYDYCIRLVYDIMLEINPKSNDKCITCKGGDKNVKVRKEKGIV